MIPNRLGGTSDLARWLNELREAVIACQVRSVSGGRVSYGAAGTTIALDAIAGGRRQFLLRLKSVEHDYIVCRTWDGTTEYSGDIAVAKPMRLRTSVTTEMKYGIEHAYTYAAGPDSLNLQRTDAWTEGETPLTEDQLVTPPWTLDEEIEVMYGETTVVLSTSPVMLRMTAPWRQWAKISA